jgi:hypothetical protein
MSLVNALLSLNTALTPCTVAAHLYRYVCEDTLEPHIMELQEAKRALGSGALKKLTPEEARKVTLYAYTCSILHIDKYMQAV